MKTRILLFVLAAMLCFSPSAKAVIGGIDTTPERRNVTFSSGATFTMTWRIQTTATPPITLKSTRGEFRRDGNTTVPWATTRAITRRVASAPNGVVNVTETVTVPQSVMRNALEQNNGRFIYFRSWTDDNFVGIDEQDIDLVVAAGMGGELSLSQATLTFNNGTTFRTVPKNEELTATARISVNGSGKFRAVWEVGDSTGGSSFFRPIETVNRTLAGKRFLVLESPKLPTSVTGRYEVRLRITDPGNTLDIPTLSYFVTDGDAGEAGVPRVAVTAPEMNAAIGRDTPFKWQSHNTAVAYRLQVLDKSNGSPVASQMVKGNESALSAFVIGQLQAPAVYLWRVLAIDDKGNVVGASEPRSFRTRP